MLRLALLVVVATPSIAFADAVGPTDPSVICPDGARIEDNHCGTVCIARHCSSDGECGTGMVCRPNVSLCANDEPYCGMVMSPYERIYGTCEGGCAVGECRTFGACVPGTPGTDAGGTGTDAGGESTDAGTGMVVTYGCGCRILERTSPGAGALSLLALALLLGRRRRRGSVILSR